MTRDRRSAPQHSPNFVWEALDSHAPEHGPALGFDDAQAGGEGDECEREAPQHGTGARRTAPGRALIAAAVLVPLAGGSYAVVAYSTRPGDTAVVTAGSTQAPGLDVSAGSDPGSGPTGQPSLSAGAGAHSSASPTLKATASPSLSPSAGKSGASSGAGASQTPSQDAKTAATPPSRSTAPSAPAKTPAAPHTDTTAAGPATGRIVGYQGLCLDDRGASVTNYNPVQVFTCNGTEAQQWILEPNDTIEVFGMCLDVYAAGTGGGTKVDLFQCNGTNAQTWVPQSDGALVNPESGQCLDDTKFGGAGTQVEIWTCNGGSDQVWKLP